MSSKPTFWAKLPGGGAACGGGSPSRRKACGAEAWGVTRAGRGWEPKPVAVLAIEATWPERSETEDRPYEPWTMASRWEQRMAEKVAGFGGVILQGSPSLCLVAFGLPQTLEQLPQRAVQAALAIRHQAAEAQVTGGPAPGPSVRLAGHLGTLLVAAETGEAPGRWLAVGETLSLPVRLLGHAEPGELLVSAPMARLTDGWMEVQAYPLSSGAEPSHPLLAYRVVGLLPQQVRSRRGGPAGPHAVAGTCTRAGRTGGGAGPGRRRSGAGGRDCGRARHGQVTAPRGMAPIPGSARGHLPGRALLVLRPRHALPARARPVAGALRYHAR